MSREDPQQALVGSFLTKRTIKAKEFVAAFRENPDHFHLLLRFSITPQAA